MLTGNEQEAFTKIYKHLDRLLVLADESAFTATSEELNRMQLELRQNIEFIERELESCGASLMGEDL